MRLLSKLVVVIGLFLALGIAHAQSRPVIDDSALKQPLEHYELSSLRFIKFHRFLFWKSAEILSPDGKVHKIRRGAYIGKNDGRVFKITEQRVELTELYPDGDGGWVEKSASILHTE